VVRQVFEFGERVAPSCREALQKGVPALDGFEADVLRAGQAEADIPVDPVGGGRFEQVAGASRDLVWPADLQSGGEA